MLGQAGAERRRPALLEVEEWHGADDLVLHSTVVDLTNNTLDLNYR